MQQAKSSLGKSSKKHSSNYFESSHWTEYIKRKIEAESGLCSCCGTTAGDFPQFHHLNTDKIGSEDLEDVLLLCPKCKRGLDYLISLLDEPSPEEIHALLVRVFEESQPRHGKRIKSKSISGELSKKQKNKKLGELPKINPTHEYVQKGKRGTEIERQEYVECYKEYQRILNDKSLGTNPSWNGISQLGMYWYRKYLREVQKRQKF